MLTLILIVVITTKLSFLNLSYKSMNIYIYIYQIHPSKQDSDQRLPLPLSDSLSQPLSGCCSPSSKIREKQVRQTRVTGNDRGASNGKQVSQQSPQPCGC